jgi:transcription elongation factor GreA
MTQQSEQNAVWLTQEAYDKLGAELEELKGPVLQEIVRRISDARAEGDLSENGGYHAAKDEQGRIVARIRQLEATLDRAQVGETPADDGVVEPGMKVTVKFAGEKDPEEFLLGAREMKDIANGLTVYSPQSPMGAAIIGKVKGDVVGFEVNGNKQSVEILNAVPFTG